MSVEDDEPVGKAKGGHARAHKLPPERRSEIAKQAAQARWSTPVTVIENAETGDQFVLFTGKSGAEFQLRFDGAEPWATQKQIADLLGLKQSNISLQIRKLIKDGEIDPESNIDKINIAGSDKPVRIYSLDVILAIGFKARSTRQAIMFRNWAKDILRRYLISGFVIDLPRLEDPDGRPDHFAELLAKVRHIRSSEMRMWTRVLELASFCSDYGLMTNDDRQNFFATIQNAMHWSVTQMTAAETIDSRVDSMMENAGVVTFNGDTYRG